MVLYIKTINKFLEDKWHGAPSVVISVVLHLCYLSFIILCARSRRFFPPVVSHLVVALQSFSHEQFPEVLRGEFLHVLAVVVNLPCWRVATCIHAPTQKNTNTRPQKQTYIHLYTDMNKQAAKHQISGEQSKRNSQNVVRRRRRAEQRETAGERVVDLEAESINFK